MLNEVAASLDATPMQVALVWLLWRSRNILQIPGRSSVQHLRENLKAATLEFSSDALADLDSIGAAAVRTHSNCAGSVAPLFVLSFIRRFLAERVLKARLRYSKR
jgi:diketogulonate reductase-like aldo/keto reductase